MCSLLFCSSFVVHGSSFRFSIFVFCVVAGVRIARTSHQSSKKPLLLCSRSLCTKWTVWLTNVRFCVARVACLLCVFVVVSSVLVFSLCSLCCLRVCVCVCYLLCFSFLFIFFVCFGAVASSTMPDMVYCMVRPAWKFSRFHFGPEKPTTVSLPTPTLERDDCAICVCLCFVVFCLCILSCAAVVGSGLIVTHICWQARTTALCFCWADGNCCLQQTLNRRGCCDRVKRLMKNNKFGLICRR